MRVSRQTGQGATTNAPWPTGQVRSFVNRGLTGPSIMLSNWDGPALHDGWMALGSTDVAETTLAALSEAKPMRPIVANLDSAF